MSQQTVTEFWQEVKGFRDEIKASIAGSKAQPKDGTCFIMSIKNRDRGTQANSMVQATIQLAGQRLCESTHRLATDAEIADYHKEHKQRAEDIHDAEVRKKLNYVTQIGVHRSDTAVTK